MATPYAFATLVTSDSYLPGALALVAALRDIHPSPSQSPEVDFQTVCLVTPETVDVSSIRLLRKVFNVVLGVEIIEQEDDKNLRLLGRPDLNTVLTKLHIFRLTQYSKIIFLDADVLPVRPLSHLFTLPHEFSAVPDVGWPDIFNSGVMVVSPGEDKFNDLMQLQKTKGSWDGGDQGLLNEWRGSNWNRLSFIYNTTPTAAYTYAPAYERFGTRISAVHFIGPNKPWKSLQWRAPGTKSTETTVDDGTKRVYDYDSLVDRWYDVYDRHYRQDTPAPRREFEVQRYTSAWDEASSLGAETPSTYNGEPPAPRSALGLQDLRRMAIEGLGALAVGTISGPAEGEYRSMPLAGRIDLMRTQKHEEQTSQHYEGQGSSSFYHGGDDGSPATPRPSHIQIPSQEQQGYFRMETLPTPAPYEVPSAPYLHGHSLPPTQTNTPYYDPNSGQSYHQQPQMPWYRPDSSESDTSPASRAPHHQSQEQHQQSEEHQWQSGSRAEHQRYGGNSRYYPGHHPGRDSGFQTPMPGRPEQHVYVHSHDAHQGHHHEQGQSQHSQGQAHDHQHHHGTHQVHHHEHGQSQQYQGQVHDQHNHGSHHHHHHHHHHEPPARPASPPKVSWNPALEPPPKEAPPVSAFPENTYYPNVWDQTGSQQHDATHQSYRSPDRSERSDTFFHPPPPSNIPEQLVREGQYANVIGSTPHQSPESVSSPPAPDRKKVHAVFPWEEKPRHSPRRVFPRTESPPPPANYIESERTSSPVSTPPPPTERRAPPLIQSPTSPTSSPWGLGFSNAWDTVPSIQRYASKLAGSPKIFPHQFMSQPPPEPREGWRKLEKERERDWQEHQDASSMDGDDEGESDEESEHSESSAKSKTSTGSHRKSRALSGKSKKKYCARGVQAVPETKEESIQVNVMVRDGVMHTLREASVATDSHSTTAPCPCCGRSCVPEECASSQASPQQRTGVGLGIRRWPESTGLLPSAVPRDFKAELEQMAGTPIATKNVRSGLPFPGSASPTGLRSPATLGSPRTYSPPKATSPPLAALPPPKVASPKAISPLQAPSPTKAMSPKNTSPRQIISPPPLATHDIHSPHHAPSPRRTSTSSMTGSSRTGSPVIGTGARMQQSSTPSPKLTRLSSLSSPFSPTLQRSTSNESAVTPSPSTTHDSLVTPENTPIGARKSGRVWDPARGVDVFKRGSEEVLARFLRMGSFDEEEGKRQAV